jgi:hypothetical protein
MPADIRGLQLIFGITSADTPTGVTGFICRSLDLKEEPEVFAMAMDGQGAVEAIAASNTNVRIQTATFTGYIDKDSFNAQTTAASGILTFRGLSYFVKSVSEPVKKGEFTEVSMEAEHLPLVQN